MAYIPPTFNLSGNIWRAATPPPAPPTLITPCQLRAAGKQSTGQDSLNNAWPFLWSALFPRATDVRDPNGPALGDIVEIPGGTGRYYDVIYVDDVSRGFANEYRIAFLRKRPPWPAPIP